MARGSVFHGEVDSANAAGGEVFALYLAGMTTAYSLGPGEILNITDYSVIRAAAGTFKIVADSDAAGRVIVKNPGAAAAGVDRCLNVPYSCPAGVTPKLIAADGDIVATIRGTITSA